MAIIKNIHGEIMRQDDLPTIKQTLEAWVAEFRSKGEIPNLRGSDLSGSNLSGSDLSYSNLSGSDLSYSNLSYSNLSGSDLSYSNLSGSDLSGSNLHFLGNCSRGYGLYLHFESEAIIRAGCRAFTMDQAIEHWSGRHSDNPILRAEILGKLECAKMIIAAREAAKTEESK